MKLSPIVIVEDDIDDCEMLVNSLKELAVQNEFICFENPVPALAYLKNTVESPFIIISDINMPRMNGLSFKKAINEDISLNKKKIPFILLSTCKEKDITDSAYNLSVQGYFEKPGDYKKLKEIAKAIIAYWEKSTFRVNN